MGLFLETAIIKGRGLFPVRGLCRRPGGNAVQRL